MSKWEGTVMSDKEINVVLKDYSHYFYDPQGRRYEGYWAVLKIALKAQAEISFKARQDEIDLLHSILNEKEVAIIDLKSMLELAKEYAIAERKAGIKEVVRWIDYYLALPELPELRDINFNRIFRPQWQAFKKKIGVL